MGSSMMASHSVYQIMDHLWDPMACITWYILWDQKVSHGLLMMRGTNETHFFILKNDLF